MKNKYITTQILLACLSKPVATQNDIRSQLAETITERRKIMQQWEALIKNNPQSTIKMLQSIAA